MLSIVPWERVEKNVLCYNETVTSIDKTTTITKKREENTYLRTHIIMTEATQHWILRKWDVIVPMVKHVRSMHNFRPSGKTEEAYI